MKHKKLLVMAGKAIAGGVFLFLGELLREKTRDDYKARENHRIKHNYRR